METVMPELMTHNQVGSKLPTRASMVNCSRALG